MATKARDLYEVGIPRRLWPSEAAIEATRRIVKNAEKQYRLLVRKTRQPSRTKPRDQRIRLFSLAQFKARCTVLTPHLTLIAIALCDGKH